MMEIVEYRPCHVGDMWCHPRNAWIPPGDLLAVAHTRVTDMGFTLMDGPRVIACGGVGSAGPKTGEAWLLVARGVERRAKTLCREVLRHLDAIMTAMDLDRVEIAVKDDDETAARFARFLGFVPTDERCSFQDVSHRIHIREVK